MFDIFLLKLFLSFVIGSFWITLVSVFSEKYGTKMGGIITGLPSTIVISLFFIGWTESPIIAVKATTVIPMIGGINCLFILVYILLLRINFWLSLFGSLLLWFISSLVLIIIGFNNFIVSLISYSLLLFISYYILERKLKVKSEMSKKTKYGFFIMLYRGVFGGFIITMAVIMSKMGGPLLGGMFSVFPAMFLGTLLITYFSQGPSFSSAVMKVSILSAISVIIYGISVRYTYLPFGLWTGTFISIFISFGSSYLIHYFVIKNVT